MVLFLYIVQELLVGLIEATECESDKVVKDKIKTAQLETVMIFLRLLIEILLVIQWDDETFSANAKSFGCWRGPDDRQRLLQ